MAAFDNRFQFVHSDGSSTSSWTSTSSDDITWTTCRRKYDGKAGSARRWVSWMGTYFMLRAGDGSNRIYQTVKDTTLPAIGGRGAWRSAATAVTGDIQTPAA